MIGIFKNQLLNTCVCETLVRAVRTCRKRQAECSALLKLIVHTHNGCRPISVLYQSELDRFSPVSPFFAKQMHESPKCAAGTRSVRSPRQTCLKTSTFCRVRAVNGTACFCIPSHRLDGRVVRRPPQGRQTQGSPPALLCPQPPVHRPRLSSVHSHQSTVIGSPLSTAPSSPLPSHTTSQLSSV